MKANRTELLGFWGQIIFNVTMVIAPVVIVSYIYSIFFQYELNDFLKKELDISNPKLLMQQQKIMEYAFYVHIILISFIALAFNTIYSFINFQRSKSKSKLGIVTSILYIFWIISFMSLVVYISIKYESIKCFIIDHDYQSIESYFENLFNKFVKGTGDFTLLLYFIFILIDFFQWLSVRKTSKVEGELSLQQIWLIDVTTIIGVYSIMKIDSFIDTTMLSESLDIFTVGSVGMQIIISQIIFCFINARYYYNLYLNKSLLKESQI